MNEDNTDRLRVRDLFDQAFGRNIKRLIGDTESTLALSLNLATISCFIFLAERENEIESLPPELADRYSQETLLTELAETGVDVDEELTLRVRDMIEKDYIDVDEQGRFFAEKPTLRMVRLLDHIFPNMPGLNLVAYFIQTMEEVLSGRKDLDSAITQFDQVLQIQGVPLQKEAHKSPLHPGKGVTHQGPRESQRTGGPRSPAAPEWLRAGNPLELPPVSPSGARIISSDVNLNQVEIRDLKELFTDPDDFAETFPEVEEISAQQASGMPEEEQNEALIEKDRPEDLIEDTEISSETSLEIESGFNPQPSELDAEEGASDTPTEVMVSGQQGESMLSTLEEKETDSSQPEELMGEKLPPDALNEPASASETEPGAKSVPEETAPDNIDEMIEKQIAKFEQDLSMQCPTCKANKIKTEQTAMGKVYYRCADDGCDFISWGKPYHFVCPQCNNPFLIEKPMGKGKIILKCPRATCRYWQKHPSELEDSAAETTEPTRRAGKPRRKVVRRRVVRRKR